jgi:hypothetical protein
VGEVILGSLCANSIQQGLFIVIFKAFIELPSERWPVYKSKASEGVDVCKVVVNYGTDVVSGRKIR